MFTDPNMIGKLASNPRTAKFLSDPAFVSKVYQLEDVFSTFLTRAYLTL